MRVCSASTRSFDLVAACSCLSSPTHVLEEKGRVPQPASTSQGTRPCSSSHFESAFASHPPPSLSTPSRLHSDYHCSSLRPRYILLRRRDSSSISLSPPSLVLHTISQPFIVSLWLITKAFLARSPHQLPLALTPSLDLSVLAFAVSYYQGD